MILGACLCRDSSRLRGYVIVVEELIVEYHVVIEVGTDSQENPN